MIQKDYSQYSLNELYGMYTKSLNDNEDKSKIIFEEITRKEKTVLRTKEDKNKKAPLFLYLIASVRNMCVHLSLYVGLRVAFTLLVLKISLPQNFEDFGQKFFYIFLSFLIAGIIASQSIKKNTGKYNHTIYLKYEIIILFLVIVFLELFHFN